MGHISMQSSTFKCNSHLNFKFSLCLSVFNQGSHRLEKYLNLEGSLEKSFKIKSALKSTENHSKALKSP